VGVLEVTICENLTIPKMWAVEAWHMEEDGWRELAEFWGPNAESDARNFARSKFPGVKPKGAVFAFDGERLK